LLLYRLNSITRQVIDSLQTPGLGGRATCRCVAVFPTMVSGRRSNFTGVRAVGSPRNGDGSATNRCGRISTQLNIPRHGCQSAIDNVQTEIRTSVSAINKV